MATTVETPTKKKEEIRTNITYVGGNISAPLFCFVYKENNGLFSYRGTWAYCKAYLQNTLADYPHLFKDAKKAHVCVQLSSEVRNVLRVINHVERRLKVKTFTKAKRVTNTERNVYVFEIDKYWFVSTHLISMWSLIIRIADKHYNGVIHPKEFLEKCTYDHWGTTWPSSQNGKAKYKYFLEHGPVIIPPDKISGGNSIHEAGILSLQLPIPPVKTT